MRPEVLIGIGVFALSLIVTTIIVGYLLVRMPSDHFCRAAGSREPQGGWTPLRILKAVSKNVLGGLLVVVGVILSIPGVPGQGFLTILLGLMLVDIPGKRGLELWILHRRGVLEAINKLRSRFNRPPLQIEA